MASLQADRGTNYAGTLASLICSPLARAIEAAIEADASVRDHIGTVQSQAGTLSWMATREEMQELDAQARGFLDQEMQFSVDGPGFPTGSLSTRCVP